MTKIIKMETTVNKQQSRILFSDKTKKVIVDIIGYLFIALFIYAAVSKLLDYEKFKAQMGQSAMLTPYVSVLAWAVPGIEFLIVLLLFIPRTILIGLYASFALMVLFTAYIGILLIAGGRLPCSCGGILEKMSWVQHLNFNIGFVILALIAFIFQTQLNKNKAR